MLLQQGHQEVDRQVDVVHHLVLVHLGVADGNVQAQHLKLEKNQAKTHD